MIIIISMFIIGSHSECHQLAFRIIISCSKIVTISACALFVVTSFLMIALLLPSFLLFPFWFFFPLLARISRSWASGGLYPCRPGNSNRHSARACTVSSLSMLCVCPAPRVFFLQPCTSEKHQDNASIFPSRLPTTPPMLSSRCNAWPPTPIKIFQNLLVFMMVHLLLAVP